MNNENGNLHDMNQNIIEAIYQVIDEVNPLLSGEMKLDKSLNTVILGENGKLDSLGMVNFIVAMEDKIKESFGFEISLSDEKVIAEKNSPLSTVQTLSDYICSFQEEK